MKRSAVRFLLSAAGAAFLASCGGGGDESGSPTPLSVVPSDIKVQGDPPDPLVPGSKGTCAVNATTSEVFVYGGVAPFRIDNTVPAYVSVSKTTLQDKGESFVLTFRGGCVDPGQIVIVDHLDHQVVLTVHNVPGT